MAGTMPMPDLDTEIAFRQVGALRECLASQFTEVNSLPVAHGHLGRLSCRPGRFAGSG